LSPHLLSAFNWDMCMELKNCRPGGELRLETGALLTVRFRLTL